MEMPVVLQIIAASMLGGVLSVLAAALVMLGILPTRLLGYAVSFSIGILLTTANLHLLPEALESGLSPDQVFPIFLAGILGFFFLEKFAIWRHVHGNEEDEVGERKGEKPISTEEHEAHCNDHTHAHHHHHFADMNGGMGLSIIIGNTLHVMTDGLLIAAAFLLSPSLGWATTFAIVAHEVPREAGDFAILLSAGWSRSKAVYWSVVSSLFSVFSAVAGFYALAHMQKWVPYLITVAAASFMYIAISDLMPRLKRDRSTFFWHGLMIALGIVISVVSLYASHEHAMPHAH